MTDTNPFDLSRREILGTAAGLATAALAGNAMAQAITAPASARRPVTFKNNQIAMAGELHLPAGFDEGRQYPAIVVAHPAGAVKEQTPAVYATRLAKRGLVVLTFDASHQGASGGEPRYLENPYERVEDVRCAVDYLSNLSFVDGKRIGALGVCAGGGYAITAATTDRRIKAVAGVSATDAGAAIREGWEGDLPVSEQLKMLEAVSAQRTAEAKGAAVAYGPYVPEVVDEKTLVTMREAREYYRTPRAQHPNSPNKVMFTSLDKLLTYSATDRIDTLLTQPLLVIVGSKSDARRYADAFHQKAASKDKELFVLAGATHVDLYDVPKCRVPTVHKRA